MTLFSEEVIFSNRCIGDLMPNLMKNLGRLYATAFMYFFNILLYSIPNCLIMKLASNQNLDGTIGMEPIVCY